MIDPYTNEPFLGMVDGVVVELGDEECLEILARREAAAAAEAQAAQDAMHEYMQSVRGMRMDLLNVMAGIATAAMIDADTVIPQAFKAARANLLALPQHPTVKAATTLEELEAAVKAEYARIVAATPAALRVAFKEVQP